MAKITVYRTYRFLDKDPVIDKVRTVLQDEKMIGHLGQVSQLSGVSYGTLSNWFDGNTKKPQHATIAAVITAVGYEIGFSKSHTIDLDAELAKARAWAKRNPKTKKRARKRKAKNGA